ncbi:hypothetical protein DRF67_18360 [Chryseobacterium pennipullorum]|uniref:Uncharacterized protein n=2 Tax=Chryseobacterium pennipullorum TaxID=2258963 RepID=A0A3D9ASJ2_9FLAO|nr:hypothetical protein DRF67_18360 [Chryseobacterium pennipullorum]
MFAQNYRFVYEYKMKSDIDNKDSQVIDYMNLDSDGKKSYFYNAVKYERILFIRQIKILIYCLRVKIMTEA